MQMDVEQRKFFITMMFLYTQDSTSQKASKEDCRSAWLNALIVTFARELVCICKINESFVLLIRKIANLFVR